GRGGDRGNVPAKPFRGALYPHLDRRTHAYARQLGRGHEYAQPHARGIAERHHRHAGADHFTRIHVAPQHHARLGCDEHELAGARAARISSGRGPCATSRAIAAARSASARRASTAAASSLCWSTASVSPARTVSPSSTATRATRPPVSEAASISSISMVPLPRT